MKKGYQQVAGEGPGAAAPPGVDLLYETGFRGPRVVEANAFGDLLPNLTREGLSPYGWEIRAALAAAA